MIEHPAESRTPGFGTFLWRWFTGNHLDGKRRTNATWFKKGTVPPHHCNWWSAKPRFHRSIWRWAMVLVPIGWVILYRISPVWNMNLTLVGTLAFLPYAIHHGLSKVVSMFPRHTVVFVRDDIRREDIDTELDEEALPDQFVPDDIQAELDRATDDEIRKSESNARKKRGA